MDLKTNAPKGLVIFALVQGLSALYSIKVLLHPNSHMIYFGLIFSGAWYKIYYLALALIGVSIAYGALRQRKWAYQNFVILTGYYVITFLGNLIFTEYETLIKTGWRLTDNSMSPFYIVQTFALCFSIVLFLWLHKYRTILK